MIFADGLRSFGQAPAVIDGDGHEFSYADLADRVDDVAGRLGTERKKLVVVCSDNSPGAIIGYLAALKAGHAVYLSPDAQGPGLDGFVARFDPEAIIRGKGAETVLEMRADAATSPLHPDLGVLLGTSGSSGTSKLVRLSWRNIQSNAESIAAYLGLGPDERAMLALKFSYSYGLSVLNSHLLVGGAVLLTGHTANTDAFWADFAARRATSLAGVPHTFETILLRGPDTLAVPSLRYCTQAGGRMAPDMVQRLAELGRRQGWKLFVMYGQTEAAPRISYLPPDMTARHPDCIGIPVPGGAIELRDADDNLVTGDETPGELVYRGPNVMMGYARDRADLAKGAELDALRTGDLAVRTAEGLFRIVGRLSRIVKPFGIRINLDDLESDLAAEGFAARCAGDDRRLVVAVLAPQDAAPVRAALAQRPSMPMSTVSVHQVEAMPLLDTGKIDYPAILRLADGEDGNAAPPGSFGPGIAGLFREYANTLAELLGLTRRRWTSVGDIYVDMLGADRSDVERQSFISLGGDSLSYVQITLALEDYIGTDLPRDWENLSAGDLERLAQVGT